MRPVSKKDHSFYRDEDGYILPRVLSKLSELDYVSDIIFSLPSNIPKEFLLDIESWGYDVILDVNELPQQRIKNIFDKKNLRQAVIFTGYNYFIDEKSLIEAIKFVHEDKVEAAFCHDVIPMKRFSVLNKSAVKFLSTYTDSPIAPPNIPNFLVQNDKKINYEAIKGLESKGESLLWELFFAGQRAILPEATVALFFTNTSPEKWLCKNSFKEFLKKILEIKDWEKIDACVEKLDLQNGVTEIASQIRWVFRFVPYLPQTKICFLEIGFGIAPVSSFVLSRVFEKGIAIEPYYVQDVDYSLTQELLSVIFQTIPQFDPLRDYEASSFIDENKLELRYERLQELELQDSTIDFCFSKSVFEHILDVESVSEELLRIMKPGAVMIHEIDFRDHERREICFNFLKYSKEEWIDIQKCTNLWRINDFVSCWKNLGFEVEVLSRLDTSLIPKKIHSSWKNYSQEDLLCHVATIKAVKK